MQRIELRNTIMIAMNDFKSEENIFVNKIYASELYVEAKHVLYYLLHRRSKTILIVFKHIFK